MWGGNARPVSSPASGSGIFSKLRNYDDHRCENYGYDMIVDVCIVITVARDVILPL